MAEQLIVVANLIDIDRVLLTLIAVHLKVINQIIEMT